LILDVRSKEAFAAAHIPESINIPLGSNLRRELGLSAVISLPVSGLARCGLWFSTEFPYSSLLARDLLRALDGKMIVPPEIGALFAQSLTCGVLVLGCRLRLMAQATRSGQGRRSAGETHDVRPPWRRDRQTPALRWKWRPGSGNTGGSPSLSGIPRPYARVRSTTRFCSSSGAAGGAVVSTLRVEWPGVGGVVNVNEFYNINIGQGGIYRVTEGTTGIGSGVLTPVTLGVAAGDVPPQPGDECGETDSNNPNLLQEPWYSQDFGPAILVWKDCGTNAWHLRTKGGQSETTVSYQGRLRSTVPFTSITGFDVDAFDSFEVVSQNEATFTLNVIGVNEDGIDFEAPAVDDPPSHLDASLHEYLGRTLIVTVPLDPSP